MTRPVSETAACGVCLGKPLASGRECICGGIGTEQAEMHGLRVALFEAEEELARLRAENERLGKWYDEQIHLAFEVRRLRSELAVATRERETPPDDSQPAPQR